MVTTIQLHEDVKSSLDKLKSDRETYEIVIKKMIETITHNKQKTAEALKEGYTEMATESLKISKEWSAIDSDWK